MRNGNFTKQTLTILYKRAGEHCTLCKKITTRPHRDPEKFHNLGEGAHINGVKNGPNLRYDSSLSISELQNPRNGIWLCKTCHHIIDNDEVTYSVIVLKELKEKHESLIIRLQQSGETLMPSLLENDLLIEKYKRIISTQENGSSEEDWIYNEELNRIKFSLATLEKEKEFLSNQLNKIKSQIIDLDNTELQKALLAEADISKALGILSEEKLANSEITIAKSRVLRGRLLISIKDFVGAVENFEKAFAIYPRFEIAIEFIQLLYFKSLDYERIIKVCEEALNNENDLQRKIKLLEQNAQAHLKLGKPEFALGYLSDAKDILIEVTDEISDRDCHLAIITKHIGDCYKLIGKLKEALQSYEGALNLYFQAFLNDNDAGKVQDFAGLATAIGLLYEANNNETEGLIHHLRAKDVIKNNEEAKIPTALILMNLASCYLKKCTFNPVEANNNIKEAISILTEIAKNEPNECLEYLVGAKCLLGDISIILDPQKAEEYYLESLRLGEILHNINPIFIHTISHVLHNYSVYLVTIKKEYKKGIKVLDDSIEKIRISQISKSERINYLSQALFFKSQLVGEKQHKINLLNEIIELTTNLDPSDKSIVLRFSAEKYLQSLRT